MRATPAKYRVAEGPPPLPGIVGAAGVPEGQECVERALPASAALLWSPVGRATADPTIPILFTQSALASVHAHLAARSEGAASLGFLVGQVCIAPEARLTYLLVESTVQMPWSVSGDHPQGALAQGLELALHEVRTTGRRVLGWYQCHVAFQARLSGADVEAHRACFGQPWHIALVVARGVELQGGLFRVGPDGGRAEEPLPFYEVTEPGMELPAEQRAAMTWANYRTLPLGNLERGAQLGAAIVPRVLFLADDAGVDEFDVDVPRAPAASHSKAIRLAAAGVLGVAVLFGAYKSLAGGRPNAPAGAAGSTVTVTAVAMERMADSVMFAINAFDIRARLFATRKMACGDLARGLVEVEERWMAYNTARRLVGRLPESGASAAGAAEQAGRDRRLQADVGSVEDRFARSGCPRP